MIYKTMKVFDCQTMPDKLRRTFFDIEEVGNDVYVSWTIGHSDPDDMLPGALEIDKWLIANGARPGIPGEAEGETVIISHWW